jgi:hypothetical protein
MAPPVPDFDVSGDYVRPAVGNSGTRVGNGVIGLR